MLAFEPNKNLSRCMQTYTETVRTVMSEHKSHYGSKSNQNKRQSSELIHFQFPLISKTPTSAKSFETRKHLNIF